MPKRERRRGPHRTLYTCQLNLPRHMPVVSMTAAIEEEQGGKETGNRATYCSVEGVKEDVTVASERVCRAILPSLCTEACSFAIKVDKL
eukprot:3701512-Rhodomonas_salina.1